MQPAHTTRTSPIRSPLSFLKRGSIYTIVALSAVAPIAIWIAWVTIARQLFSGEVPVRYTYLVGAFSMLVLSLGGIAEVLRKEAPSFLPGGPYRGPLAVAEGILIVAIAWSIAVALLYYAITAY